jgi:hypothetical protein
LAFGKDRIVALLEDAAAILGAALIVARATTRYFDAIVIGAGEIGPQPPMPRTIGQLGASLVGRREKIAAGHEAAAA